LPARCAPVTIRALPCAAAALLLLAGCHRRAPEEATPSPVALEKAMRGNVAEGKRPPLRLGALRPEDGRALGARAGCRLTRGADTLVLAGGGNAVARVDGQLRRIPQAGPVDASGAFFRDPAISISVGAPDPRLGSGPAGVTVSGAGNDPPQKIDGVWSCGR
jgi:hypothetical protein